MKFEHDNNNVFERNKFYLFLTFWYVMEKFQTKASRTDTANNEIITVLA